MEGDPEKLSAYNDRARQKRNEAERSTKLDDDSSVYEKTVAESSGVKQPQKSPKTTEFVDTGLSDSGTEDEQKPKKVKKTSQSKNSPKSPEFIDPSEEELKPKKGSGNRRKVKKTSQPKNPPKSPAFIDPGKEEQKPKKGSSDAKKAAKKAGKKVKRTSQIKNLPKSSEFIESSKEEIRLKLLELLIDSSNDEEEGLPLLRQKEEVQSFFDLRKDSENLTIKKKVGKVVFVRRSYKGYKLSHVPSNDT